MCMNHAFPSREHLISMLPESACRRTCQTQVDLLETASGQAHASVNMRLLDRRSLTRPFSSLCLPATPPPLPPCTLLTQSSNSCRHDLLQLGSCSARHRLRGGRAAACLSRPAATSSELPAVQADCTPTAFVQLLLPRLRNDMGGGRCCGRARPLRKQLGASRLSLSECAIPSMLTRTIRAGWSLRIRPPVFTFSLRARRHAHAQSGLPSRAHCITRDRNRLAHVRASRRKPW